MHEQNNKVIKGSGGAKRLLNKTDESGLIRWETVGSDVARIISEFKNSVAAPSTKNTRKHHEDNKSFQQTFFNDVQKVYHGIVSNPFQLSELTSISNTSLAFPDIVFHNISILEATGKQKFNDFLTDRLLQQKVAIDATVSKSQFVLPGTLTQKLKEKRVKARRSNKVQSRS